MTEEYFDDIENLIKKVNNAAAANDDDESDQDLEGSESGDGNGISKANKIDVSAIIRSDTKAVEEEERLATNKKLSADDINFVINTIKKEAQYDELSIKQLLYGMASAFTKRPIHHIVNSKEAGAGKNYLLELVSRYFPDQYVTPLGNMSDKALFHRRVLVITDPSTGKEQPILPIITMLNEEKDILEEEIAEEKSKDSKSKDKDKDLIRRNAKRILEIQSEIKDIEASAQKLIEILTTR
jgi:hypothetical protein